VLKRLKQEWQHDPFRVAALVTVSLGFASWAAPMNFTNIAFSTTSCISSRLVQGERTEFSLLLVEFFAGCGELRIYFAEGWFQFDRLPAVLFFFTLAAFFFWRGTLSGAAGIRRR
jgi:hypothetical protein